MNDTYLIITSIAPDTHPVLNLYAREASKAGVPFLVIGDRKSPLFHLDGCDFYSVERQAELPYKLARLLPYGHYARKNLGYIEAANRGAEVIIETDDDNYPDAAFLNARSRETKAARIEGAGWINVYRYYSDQNIWPRGFALEHVLDTPVDLDTPQMVVSPIWQGLADRNPDIDAIYRLTQPLPVHFDKTKRRIALAEGSICPFNSQNTTWFREAFPLMYLPSYCSFRMTDIWRSFVAQRIAWTCGWSVLFHEATVWQERNEHSILNDFKDEISGYCNNGEIMRRLTALNLREDTDAIPENLRCCYRELVDMQLIDGRELPLLEAWIEDICGA